MSEAEPEFFDYAAAAELYVAQGRFRNSAIRYKRFDAAASAIRHAIEVLPKNHLAGAVLEVAEHRYMGRKIQELYDSSAYPLKRDDTGRNSK